MDSILNLRCRGRPPAAVRTCAGRVKTLLGTRTAIAKERQRATERWEVRPGCCGPVLGGPRRPPRQGQRARPERRSPGNGGETRGQRLITLPCQDENGATIQQQRSAPMINRELLCRPSHQGRLLSQTDFRLRATRISRLGICKGCKGENFEFPWRLGAPGSGVRGSSPWLRREQGALRGAEAAGALSPGG